MTEAEWLVCSDPTAMLHLLRGRASDRKARLTSCACCRIIWNLLEPSLRRAIETAEAFVDDRTPLRKLEAACKTGMRMITQFSRSPVRELGGPWPSTASAVVAATCQVWPFSTMFLEFIGYNPIYSAAQAAGIVATVASHVEGITNADAVRVVECALIRDIFGNPWREISAAHEWLAWNDATVPRIALSIYDSRDFSLMPILADALEEAGCNNADILNHCRQPGEHVRGCWVVDLLLGKS